MPDDASPITPAVADPLLTRTPLTLYGDVFTALGEDHQADPVVVLARDAVETAGAAFRATLAAHDKVMADVTHTPDANMQRSARAASRRQDEALKRLDSALERTTREIGMITEAVNRPADPAPAHLVRLVADRLAAMPSEQRSKTIGAAVASGDKVTINSVLFSGAPAWTFGLSAEELDLHRSQYQHAVFPAAMARRAALEQAVELVSRAGRSLVSAHGKLFDQKRLDAAQKAADEAARALGD